MNGAHLLDFWLTQLLDLDLRLHLSDCSREAHMRDLQDRGILTVSHHLFVRTSCQAYNYSMSSPDNM